MGGEPSPAHPYDACFLYLPDDFLFGKGSDVFGRGILHFLHFPVIFNNDGIHHVAHCAPARLDCLHLAGYGRIDRR